MKRKRIINVIVWAAIAVGLSGAVCYEWYKNGVEVFGLLAGIGIYCGFCAVGCLVVDQCIKEWHEWYGDDKDKE